MKKLYSLMLFLFLIFNNNYLLEEAKLNDSFFNFVKHNKKSLFLFTLGSGGLIASHFFSTPTKFPKMFESYWKFIPSMMMLYSSFHLSAGSNSEKITNAEKCLLMTLIGGEIMLTQFIDHIPYLNIFKCSKNKIILSAIDFLSYSCILSCSYKLRVNHMAEKLKSINEKYIEESNEEINQNKLNFITNVLGDQKCMIKYLQYKEKIEKYYTDEINNIKTIAINDDVIEKINIYEEPIIRRLNFFDLPNKVFKTNIEQEIDYCRKEEIQKYENIQKEKLQEIKDYYNNRRLTLIQEIFLENQEEIPFYKNIKESIHKEFTLWEKQENDLLIKMINQIIQQINQHEEYIFFHYPLDIINNIKNTKETSIKKIQDFKIEKFKEQYEIETKQLEKTMLQYLEKTILQYKEKLNNILSQAERENEAYTNIKQSIDKSYNNFKISINNEIITYEKMLINKIDNGLSISDDIIENKFFEQIELNAINKIEEAIRELEVEITKIRKQEIEKFKEQYKIKTKQLEKTMLKYLEKTMLQYKEKLNNILSQAERENKAYKEIKNSIDKSYNNFEISINNEIMTYEKMLINKIDNGLSISDDIIENKFFEQIELDAINKIEEAIRELEAEIKKIRKQEIETFKEQYKIKTKQLEKTMLQYKEKLNNILSEAERENEAYTNIKQSINEHNCQISINSMIMNYTEMLINKIDNRLSISDDIIENKFFEQIKLDAINKIEVTIPKLEAEARKIKEQEIEKIKKKYTQTQERISFFHKELFNYFLYKEGESSAEDIRIPRSAYENPTYKKVRDEYNVKMELIKKYLESALLKKYHLLISHINDKKTYDINDIELKLPELNEKFEYTLELATFMNDLENQEDNFEVFMNTLNAEIKNIKQKEIISLKEKFNKISETFAFEYTQKFKKIINDTINHSTLISKFINSDIQEQRIINSAPPYNHQIVIDSTIEYWKKNKILMRLTNDLENNFKIYKEEFIQKKSISLKKDITQAIVNIEKYQEWRVFNEKNEEIDNNTINFVNAQLNTIIRLMEDIIDDMNQKGLLNEKKSNVIFTFQEALKFIISGECLK